MNELSQTSSFNGECKIIRIMYWLCFAFWDQSSPGNQKCYQQRNRSEVNLNYKLNWNCGLERKCWDTSEWLPRIDKIKIKRIWRMVWWEFSQEDYRKGNFSHLVHGGNSCS